MKKHILSLVLLSFFGVGAQAAAIQVKVVDRDGALVENAVVMITPADPSKAKSKPSIPVATIAQERMQYLPRVSLVGVGQKIRLVNNDPFDHHVRGTAAGVVQFGGSLTGGFEHRMDARADGKPAKAVEQLMDKSGPVLLGCHMHSSMRAHVYVSDTPWASKTSREGTADFSDLPEGPATVRLWQADQLIDLPAQTVTVSASGVKLLEFKLQVVARKPRGS
jgi:plastocyanin